MVVCKYKKYIEAIEREKATQVIALRSFGLIGVRVRVVIMCTINYYRIVLPATNAQIPILLPMPTTNLISYLCQSTMTMTPIEMLPAKNVARRAPAFFSIYDAC